MFQLSQRSQDRLNGVHPDLCAVVRRAIEITDVDFCVTEGLRTKERQAQLFAAGASKTMNSRHLTGHAVDLAAMIDFDGDGKPEVRWDWPLYEKLAVAMKSSAEELKVKIVWGGDWVSFKDAPHFELDRKVYP